MPFVHASYPEHGSRTMPFERSLAPTTLPLPHGTFVCADNGSGQRLIEVCGRLLRLSYRMISS